MLSPGVLLSPAGYPVYTSHNGLAPSGLTVACQCLGLIDGPVDPIWCDQKHKLHGAYSQHPSASVEFGFKFI